IVKQTAGGRGHLRVGQQQRIAVASAHLNRLCADIEPALQVDITRRNGETNQALDLHSLFAGGRGYSLLGSRYPFRHLPPRVTCVTDAAKNPNRERTSLAASQLC